VALLPCRNWALREKARNLSFSKVLRIRDVYPGSSIPDPIFSIPDPGSRFDKDPGSASKNLIIFNPKKLIQVLSRESRAKKTKCV
jgi:hypothetical protein